MSGGSYQVDYHYDLTGSVKAQFIATIFVSNDSSYTSASGPVERVGGTIDGKTITGLSSFNSPSNELSDGTAPPRNAGPGAMLHGTTVQGFYDERLSTNDVNGLSVTTEDGTAYRIFIAYDSAGNPSLRVESSAGLSGPVAATYGANKLVGGCFLRGTMIRTPAGECAVEQLSIGDPVVTHGGAVRAVQWIGHTTLRPGQHRKPNDVLPIRIVAGAFAKDVPIRDLWVSPGHALLTGDVLINAGELVNGATIVRETATVVQYFHVELETHDILVADGLPCESYLDDGNRFVFDNVADYHLLHPRIDRENGTGTCLPLISHGPVLAGVRQELLLRAFELGWSMCEQPSIHLAVGDRVLAPTAVVKNRFWFILPLDGGEAMRLRSAAAPINRLQPLADDERILGVAVAQIRIDGEPVSLDTGMCGEGFHQIEEASGERWRWTNGDAMIGAGRAARVVEVEVRHVAPRLVRATDAVVTNRDGRSLRR